MRKYARLGADRDLVVTALGIPNEALRDPLVVDRLQQEILRGQAQYKIDLLGDIKNLRTGRVDGSVNAALAGLRQALGWDRPDSAKSRERKRPDQEAAVAEIERMLRRFRGGDDRAPG